MRTPNTPVNNVDSLIGPRPNVHTAAVRIASLNVQCLRTKLDLLSLFVLQYKPDILCICEHWLGESESEFYRNLEYLTLSSIWCRDVHIHGDTLIYVNTVNSYLKCNPMDLSEFCIEMDLELAATHLVNLNWVIVLVYRSPTKDLENFWSGLEGCLKFLSRHRRGSRGGR